MSLFSWSNSSCCLWDIYLRCLNCAGEICYPFLARCLTQQRLDGSKVPNICWATRIIERFPNSKIIFVETINTSSDAFIHEPSAGITLFLNFHSHSIQPTLNTYTILKNFQQLVCSTSPNHQNLHPHRVLHFDYLTAPTSQSMISSLEEGCQLGVSTTLSASRNNKASTTFTTGL